MYSGKQVSNQYRTVHNSISLQAEIKLQTKHKLYLTTYQMHFAQDSAAKVLEIYSSIFAIHEYCKNARSFLKMNS